VSSRAHSAALSPRIVPQAKRGYGFADTDAVRRVTHPLMPPSSIGPPRHKSVAVARRYIRDGSLFRGNAAAAVGL